MLSGKLQPNRTCSHTPVGSVNVQVPTDDGHQMNSQLPPQYVGGGGPGFQHGVSTHWPHVPTPVGAAQSQPALQLPAILAHVLYGVQYQVQVPVHPTGPAV